MMEKSKQGEKLKNKNESLRRVWTMFPQSRVMRNGEATTALGMKEWQRADGYFIQQGNLWELVENNEAAGAVWRGR